MTQEFTTLPRSTWFDKMDVLHETYLVEKEDVDYGFVRASNDSGQWANMLREDTDNRLIDYYNAVPLPTPEEILAFYSDDQYINDMRMFYYIVPPHIADKVVNGLESLASSEPYDFGKALERFYRSKGMYFKGCYMG